ncbi:MAG: fused MFS/spermidine synthase [Planctomycetes bacterium]|nr:fused MFS/spermidine synthase [Planctomycetota bacterium]
MTAPAAASAAGSAGAGLVRSVAAACVAGFSCMVAELAAVRILAPHFGDSAYVWTNVIGLILAALAVGAWMGGRLAGRPDAARWPSRLLITSGFVFAGVPFVAPALGAWLLPADLPLDSAMPALVRGSFVATGVLFAAPMALLGAVSPLLVSLLARRGADVGRAAGAVGAGGTIGSLLGTFAATHWLVPGFGCRVTMASAGAALVLAGVLVAVSRRTSGAAAAGALLVGISAAIGHGGPLRVAPPGRTLVAERESVVQFLQVQRESPADGPQRTLLVVNEGLDSFHSIHVEGSSLTGGAYYDWHAVAPLLAGDGARPEGLRALSIGDAAGSLRSVYAGCHPGAIVDGVDIDPACRELGDRFFGPGKAPGDAFVVDGRVFLERTRRSWHVIHVDAYAHQVYVPAHLASREFFTAAKERLFDGGVLVCNVGALERDDPVLRAMGATLATVFGESMALPVPSSRNFLLAARRGRPLAPECLAGFVFGGERLSGDDLQQWRRVVSFAAQPAAWGRFEGATNVLVDDRPVLDRLLLASYVERRDPGVVVVCDGDRDAVAAEAAAFPAATLRDWGAVLAAVRTSRSESAYLREVAGDARWSLRHLHAAALEYEAAERLAPDDVTRDRVASKLRTVREERLPVLRAADVATRAAWLEAALLLAFAIGVLLVRRWS